MMKTFCALCLVLTVLSSPLTAAPIIPVFDTFGPLPGATFGGTGIPNDAVAIATFAGTGLDTFTIGISAHERFENAPVSDNGAGVYTVQTGSNFGDPTFNTMPSPLLGATWNIGTYVRVDGGGTLDAYDIRLVYDFDPAPGTDESLHGSVGGPGPAAVLAETSQNLLFPFFADPLTPGIMLPTPSTFNPNALGQYSLALVVRDAPGPGGTELGRAAILVNAVPEPSSMLMLALGSLGCAGYVRRRKARSSVDTAA